MTSRALNATCGLLLLSLGGCEASKSSNPTAPTVAGPIAGVTISAPALLEPSQGFKFKESEQPIRLTVGNATTTGVRPLTYSFDVAVDAGFTTKVFSRSNVAPGDGNKTSVQIDRLDIGRAYYWRARAEDGANTGAYASAGFEIHPKAAIGAPAQIAPINNADAGSQTPVLQVQNATTVGPVGGIAYEFQVAADQAFTSLIAAGIVGEGNGTTTFTSGALNWGTTYYWRVRASDGETTSGWTTSQVFRTPNAPVVKPPQTPNPGGGGGGTEACDALVANKQKYVECVYATVPKPTNEFQAFEVTKRVAWGLRSEGAGLLIKNGGENIVPWQGYSFAAGRICYPDGHIYKVIGDVGPGGANSPGWSDNGFVDKSLYVPAIDPSKK